MKKLTLFFVALATLAFVTIFSNNAVAAGNGKNKNTKATPCDTVFVKVPCDDKSQVTAPGFAQQNQQSAPAPATATTPATAPTTTVAASTSDSLLAKLIKRVEALEKKPQVNVSGLNSRMNSLEAQLNQANDAANSAMNTADGATSLANGLVSQNDSLQADILWLANKVNGFETTIKALKKLDKSIDTRFMVTWLVAGVLFIVFFILMKNFYSNLSKLTDHTNKLTQAFLDRNPDAKEELFPKKKEQKPTPANNNAQEQSH